MQEWHYDPTPDFDQTPIARLRGFPRHPNLFIYAARSLANLVMRTILRFGNRLEIEGREHLPVDESFIMVANHASHLDAPSLMAALPLAQVHRAFPAAAADYFFTHLPVLAFSAIVMNAMPFDRKENPKQSIDACRQLLDARGHVLILFPEGTRTQDGSIGPFKPGIGFLIAGSDIPVVPCHIDGAFRAWPKGAWIPRPRKLKLKIGPAVRFREMQRVRENAVQIAETLRNCVIALQ